MVIGKGLVAGNFKRYETLDEFLIFASGVSNSKSCSLEDCNRERTLFLSSLSGNRSKKVVYFSTSSVNDPDLLATPYVKHKLRMEELIRESAVQYHIFRLPNLAGASDNPNTLLNFFYFAIMQGHPFELWKYSERNIIDVSDVYRVADHILENDLFPNGTVNIANSRNYSVRDIVKNIETFTGKKAVYTEKEKGSAFEIDVSLMLPVYRSLQIGFGDEYLPELLEKYYPKNEL